MISTKDFVLYALRKADGFISGEQICAPLQISRAAVNAAVKSLRADGYEIESVTNRGYRLTGGPKTLCVGELMPYLGVERAAHVTVLESAASTNSMLRQLCAQQKAHAGDCIVARMQTDGRGRMGRPFECKKDAGLYLSFVLDAKNESPQRVCELTAWAAAAVRAAIEEVCGVSCGIKWVNDLVWEKKKVCGILTEMSVEAETGRVPYVVMGVGVNVNHEASDFSDKTRDKAVSLRQICGKTIDCVQLCAAVLQRMDALCADFPEQKQPYLASYQAHDAVCGERVTVAGRRGTALGVNQDFALVVRFDDGKTQTLTGADLSVDGFYGAPRA